MEPAPAAAAAQAHAMPELEPGDRVEVLWTIDREDDEGAPAPAPAPVDAAAAAAASKAGEGGGSGEGGGAAAGVAAGAQTAAQAPPAAVTATADAEDEGMDEDEEEDTVEERWWGATVVRRAAGAHAYVVLYDAYAEFAASEVEVALVTPRTLADASADGARMHWRREGDARPARAWAMAEDGAGVVSGRALAEAVGDDGGEEAGLAALGGMSAAQQTGIAVGYRAFADEVKGEMRKLLDARGPGTVITEKDIAEMIGTLKARHGYV